MPVSTTGESTKSPEASDQSICLRRRAALVRVRGAKAGAGVLVEVFETPLTHSFCLSGLVCVGVLRLACSQRLASVLQAARGRSSYRFYWPTDRAKGPGTPQRHISLPAMHHARAARATQFLVLQKEFLAPRNVTRDQNRRGRRRVLDRVRPARPLAQ